MLKYLLDTNMVIYTMKNKPPSVREFVPLGNNPQQQGMAIVDRLGRFNRLAGSLSVCHSMALWSWVMTH